MTSRRGALVVAAAALSFAAGCNEVGPTGECTVDEDCPNGKNCEVGKCACTDGSQCAEGELCNRFGDCQPRVPCVDNRDCRVAAGEICNTFDPSGGTCIAPTALDPTGALAPSCGSDLHCSLENICFLTPGGTTGTCAPGCRTSSDCRLGSFCSLGQCRSPVIQTPDGPDCVACPVDPPDADFCDYGEQCTDGGECVGHALADDVCSLCIARCGNPQLACFRDRESCTCREKKCYPFQRDCQRTSDCDDIGGCDVGYCVPGCETDRDCPHGLDTCEPVMVRCGKCLIDADCSAPNGPCVDGFCHCANQAECTSLSEGLCTQGDNCARVVCQEDSDCQRLGGTTCNNLVGVCVGGLRDGNGCSPPAALCVAGGGTCRQLVGNCGGIECTNDAQCTCIDHLCTSTGLPCQTEADCALEHVTIETSDGPRGQCRSQKGVCLKQDGFLCEDLAGDAACQGP